ncbi:MAG: Flp family type IVb pilin [Rhizobiaceae bacterium]
MLKKFIQCESGATAIEYGLIASLVAMGMIVGFGNLADELETLWGDNNADIQGGLNN